jgi:hypothetical protein
VGSNPTPSADVTSHHEGRLAITYSNPAAALTSSTTALAAALPVTGGSGTTFSPGQLIVVDSGANAEICLIASVSANQLFRWPALLAAETHGSDARPRDC